MSTVSREQLANDGVFGADENELYDDENVYESTFKFNDIVNKLLSNGVN